MPHPNWFWMWSKYSLPFLDHPAAPRTRFLSELEELPPELESGYVLKPLFSFAGAGVNVHPVAARRRGDRTRRTRGLVPAGEDRLRRRPSKPPTAAAVKVELRVMFLRPDGASALVPATNLCRLSRGDLLGVDFNKNKTWVGSSLGIWPA